MRSVVQAAVLAVTTAIAGLAAAQTAQTSPDAAATVVARIDGDPIHMDRMQRAMRTFGRDLGQLSPQAFYETVIERLIDQELAARAAEASGIADDPEIVAQLAEIRSNVLASAFLRKIGTAATTEEALQARYAVLEAAGIKKVRARHILVKTEAKAQELIVELQGGADFAELAKQHSVGPSGKEGGDLGLFGQGQMVKAFSEAAFALESGAFTEAPVQTQFGWHVILVEEIVSDPAPPFEQAREKLAEEARTEAMIGALEDLRIAAKIEKFDPDGNPID